MTKLQWIRSLYSSGIAVTIQCGHKSHVYGLYPLRWAGRWILRRIARHSFSNYHKEQEDVMTLPNDKEVFEIAPPGKYIISIEVAGSLSGRDLTIKSYYCPHHGPHHADMVIAKDDGGEDVFCAECIRLLFIKSGIQPMSRKQC